MEDEVPLSLQRPNTLSPIRNVKVMLATAGLHNKCIDRRIPLPTEDFEIDERMGDDGQHEEQQRDSNHGRRIRHRLIQQVLVMSRMLYK
jgi:hypothetical protein